MEPKPRETRAPLLGGSPRQCAGGSLLRRTKLDELSFSLNDFGEWNSKFTPSKQIELDIEQYLNKEMKRKRRSYTFDEFIDEMSYAYKTFLHLNRIC